MPMTRPLAGTDFAPEALEVMQLAYDGLVEALKLTGEKAREEAAALIIELAAPRSILDANELRDEAIAAMKSSSPRSAA